MANPQPDQFTKVSNELLEQVPKFKLNGTQLRIILIIWRYSYGFGKKDAELSISFLAKATDIIKRQLIRELSKLIEMNVVQVVSEQTGTRSRIIQFNKDYDSWRLLEVTKKTSLPELSRGDELDTPPMSKKTPLDASRGVGLDTQKRKSLKKTIKKEEINDMSIPSEKVKFHDTVFLTIEQYEKLCNEFGKTKVDNTIEALDEWQTNKKPNQHKKDHNKTIRVWIKKDLDKYQSSLKSKQQRNTEEMNILNQFYEEGAARETDGDRKLPGNDKNRLSLF
ncbi:replication protein [Paenibacillus sp. F411]|uniref:replication protein n=1 Tax=Paenibacillus sp. F411 TaxID=2820239 RepID=UPI001AAEB63B|nr:replication protein [Paenibacillus sp. F411]MBO2943625.1 replication protein [Paenibacillus sp. F411]